MQVSKSFVALATTALVAFLAGCSGSSQFAPAQSGSATQSVNRAPAGPMRSTTYPTLNGQPAVTLNRLSDLRFMPTGAGPDKGGKTVYLYLNDDTTGNVDVFNEDTDALVAQCPACGGWGLAVSPENLDGTGELLAVGKSGAPGTVEIYDALSTGTPVHIATLNSSVGDAYGICFDNTGGVYGTNFVSGTIDHWTAAQVLGTGGAGTQTSTIMTDTRYVACDHDKLKSGENYLMASGNSGAGNHTVEEVLPVDVVVQANINYNGAHFPGGLAIDKKDDLVVNDQYGAMFDLGNKEPWKAKIKSYCTWGFNPNDYTSIVFDDTQKEIWASDIQFSSLSGTVGKSNKYPLVNKKACPTGESKGPTAPQANESQYLGVAVWPNTGV